jgi:hypothetical protein
LSSRHELKDFKKIVFLSVLLIGLMGTVAATDGFVDISLPIII